MSTISSAVPSICAIVPFRASWSISACSPRSFVFVNLPLIELLAPSGIPHGPETYRRYSWAYALAHAFMAARPDYPVLRLELRPGEGYCAPTQNLVHDGYTSEGDGPMWCSPAS